MTASLLPLVFYPAGGAGGIPGAGGTNGSGRRPSQVGTRKITPGGAGGAARGAGRSLRGEAGSVHVLLLLLLALDLDGGDDFLLLLLLADLAGLGGDDDGAVHLDAGQAAVHVHFLLLLADRVDLGVLGHVERLVLVV